MKLEKMAGIRFKETPSDCVVESHALMLRGGYMKYVANGIYSQYLPLRRILRKIEQIIREEMDAIDGQEVMFPVALPASLWEESGRFYSVGSELLRFKDRNHAEMVLGMTHEEAAVQLVREYAGSYAKYPFMIYQIQTKFRDEARPRAGLIRVREFTMKDAYSFHTSSEDLEQYYESCFQAYHRIFARAGIPEVISVASDSGMMGGNLSHEYMLLTPAGEDSIVLCGNCDFRANLEAAESVFEYAPSAKQEDGGAEPVCHFTPDIRTIGELCTFFHISPEQTCKAVAFQDTEDACYLVFLRGDCEVNEAKLASLTGKQLHPALLAQSGSPAADNHTAGNFAAGFIGPYQLQADCTVFYDVSLQNSDALICGANRMDHHYSGMNLQRDCMVSDFYDLTKAKEGGICPCCKAPALTIKRGIEVGNIFQLGTKYTEAMQMQYTDASGSLHYPYMGCYGIGIGRLAASVCESSHDAYGPIWPITIAPWQVHLCCLNASEPEIKASADSLYNLLQANRIEVLYDDRRERPGVMFSDADLLGVPIRVIISRKNFMLQQVEIVTRDKKLQRHIPYDESLSAIKQLISELTSELCSKISC